MNTHTPFQTQTSPEPGASPTRVTDGGSFELGDIVRILNERRNLIAAMAAVGLIFGIIASLTMTSLYRTSILLQLNSAKAEAQTSVGQNTARAEQRATLETLGTQVGLLNSESLATRVAENLNLASDPGFAGVSGSRDAKLKRAASTVLANMQIAPVKDSLLVRVYYVSHEPRKAALVANAIGENFIASNIERKYNSSSYARKFLSDQLARTKAAVEQSERALNDYSISSGVFRTPGQIVDGKVQEGATLGSLDLSALNVALNAARVERVKIEQAYRSGSAGPSAVTNGADAPDQQRDLLQAQYAEKLKLFKPNYPEMVELQARIAGLSKSGTSARSRATAKVRQDLQAAYQAAQQTEAQLAAKVASAKDQVLRERSRSVQYTILQRETDTNHALYDALLQRYKEVGVAAGVGQSDVSLVDSADIPVAPFRPNLALNLASGLIGGLAIGIGLAFVLHLMFDMIVNANDVREKLHLPVLGAIPYDSDDRTMLEALSDPKSDISEAYFSARTAIKFLRPEGIPHSLLFTSSRPGEGKSTSAYAIASAMARLGGRVLLVDADLRKPTFVSTNSDKFGLAHLLGSEDPLSRFVEATQIPNLNLLPVGRYVGSPADLLSSTRLVSLINDARANYDVVIIDGPPVLGLADAPLLGASVDGTVLVVESRMSRRGHVIEIIRRLVDSGASIMGVILTKVTHSNSGYGYNYYYSYNYGDANEGGRVSSEPGRSLDLNKL